MQNDIALPSLKFHNEEGWNGNVQSMSVGPNAEVSAYHHEDFKDFALLVKPNTGLDGTSGFSFSQLRSLKIKCIN